MLPAASDKNVRRLNIGIPPVVTPCRSRYSPVSYGTARGGATSRCAGAAPLAWHDATPSEPSHAERHGHRPATHGETCRDTGYVIVHVSSPPIVCARHGRLNTHTRRRQGEAVSQPWSVSVATPATGRTAGKGWGFATPPHRPVAAATGRMARVRELATLWEGFVGKTSGELGTWTAVWVPFVHACLSSRIAYSSL